ncbi:MAG TPA: SUMF1/EgtB/PvdO family nonheme iron enzyme [Stellaceae bacterium]|nr:SUMF1/EgtB/PvdO family nonheme iron enzyme [Stellaceae bacterium]
MRHEVTAADYGRCVAARQCQPLLSAAPPADRPIVKVSWRDAEAYARWLSRATGLSFRLPSDKEWAYAAGSRLSDDRLPEGADVGDPGERELVRYAQDTARAAAVDKELRPIGGVGANENGLLDMAGNVWEWTESCFRRGALDAARSIVRASDDCGIRVVEGRHRTYISDFIRDPRGGGCSVGTPPAYLGFRLVRDDDPWSGLRGIGAMLGLSASADR